jgi:hypothetical protein
MTLLRTIAAMPLLIAVMIRMLPVTASAQTLVKLNVATTPNDSGAEVCYSVGSLRGVAQVFSRSRDLLAGHAVLIGSWTAAFSRVKSAERLTTRK